MVSGTSVATLTTGGYFGELNYGTTSFTQAATNLNLNSLYSVNRTTALTNLTATMIGTGSMSTGSSIGPLFFNSNTTIVNTATCTTCTVIGTLNVLSANTATLTSTTFGMYGILNITGTLNCTVFTMGANTLDFSSGTITPSTSFLATGGSFTYSGTATLASVATFTQSSTSNVTLNKAYSLTATGTYTLLGGTLTLGASLTTGIFNSTFAGNYRSINFGTNNIILA